MQRLFILILPILLFTTACSHQNTRMHDSNTLLGSFKAAAVEPQTWMPVVAAGLINITDQDKKISDSARKHTPIFSSEAKAEAASDNLKSALKLSAIASTAFAPTDDKQTLIVSNIMGFAGTQFATDNLKQMTHRTRPNEKDDYSMPSGHTSQAFSAARINAINLQYYDISPLARTTLNTLNYTLAAGTAWARVEAGYHYPSDVLMGAALGNFITSAVNRRFFADEDAAVDLYINPSDNALGISYTMGF